MFLFYFYVIFCLDAWPVPEAPEKFVLPLSLLCVSDNSVVLGFGLLHSQDVLLHKEHCLSTFLSTYVIKSYSYQS